MKKLFNHSKRPYEKRNPDWEELVYADEEDFCEEDFYEEAEPEDEAYYAEDADGEDFCEEDFYEEAEPEDEAYYAEGADEEDFCSDETGEEYDEYDEEEIDLESEEPEEDEADGELLPWSAMAGKNVFQKAWYSFTHMSILDRVVAGTGVLVLVLALVTGAYMLSANAVNKQVSSFGAVGSELTGITVIGEHGLTAVADAELARIQAANALEEDEQEEQKEYEENEYANEVEVSLSMTSIEKDLKIKFVNTKTKKLISNVPFSVTVKTPGGAEEVWTDDDMDGIIYKSGISSGSYSVLLQAFTDTKYENYKLPDAAKKVTVKNEIAYEKVEVADEIKDESEVNAKKEDTKENETTVESALTDTVAWVESTKTVINAVYTAVDKKSVPNPLAVARNTAFLRTAEKNITMNPLTLTLKEGETVTGSVAVADPAEGAFTTKSYQSSTPSVATVDETGQVTALTVGTTTITFTATREYTDTSVSGSDSQTLTDTYSGSCVVTVNPAAPTVVAVTGVTLDKTALTLEQGKTDKLTATIAPEGAADQTVTWTSDAQTVATVTQDGTVTAVAVGTANITVASVSNPSAMATCVVTVTAPAGTKTLKLDKTTLTAAVGAQAVINATVTNLVAGGDVSGALTVEVDKKEILDATAGTAKDGVTPITLTPKAKGTAVVTVKLDGELTAICTVTVSDLVMTIDKTTLSVLAEAKEELTVVIGSISGTVTAESTDVSIAKAEVTTSKTADQTTAKVTITGVKAGSVTITVSNTENGVVTKKTCTVTVVSKENKLTDSGKQQLYVLQADGSYREATYADYYNSAITTFYLKSEGEIKYTGWQTLDGKLYFFDASGKKVTGEQVIQGAKYNFASDGSLSVGSGSFGIDVSKWNGTIDWNAVKNSGVSYVIIRCGYRGSSTGALIEDPKFVTNIKGATAAGLKVGVYFFSQAVNNSEAVEEASMVLELIKKYTISYPVFLDVEASGGRADGIDKSTRTAVIKTFCETIQNAGYGYTAGVYANKSWLTNKIDTSQLSKYKIWLAQYAASPTYTGRYDLWQYKSTGKVTGISGNVDLNISYLGY